MKVSWNEAPNLKVCVHCIGGNHEKQEYHERIDFQGPKPTAWDLLLMEILSDV